MFTKVREFFHDYFMADIAFALSRLPNVGVKPVRDNRYILYKVYSGKVVYFDGKGFFVDQNRSIYCAKHLTKNTLLKVLNKLIEKQEEKELEDSLEVELKKLHNTIVREVSRNGD